MFRDILREYKGKIQMKIKRQDFQRKIVHVHNAIGCHRLFVWLQ